VASISNQFLISNTAISKARYIFAKSKQAYDEMDVDCYKEELFDKYASTFVETGFCGM